MAAHSEPARTPPIDRTSLIGIGALVAAVIILIILIGLITLLPARTITETLSNQAREEQKVLAGSLARQVENYFNNTAYDLLGLTGLPEIKASAEGVRPAALAQLADLAERRMGQIKSIVRLSGDGTPMYAWPPDYNAKIQAGQPLPWTVTREWVDEVVQGRVVQFRLVHTTANSSAYVFVAPINPATSVSEALAIEIDLNNYFVSVFKSLQLSDTRQLWVFDRFGAELYHYHPEPVYRGNIIQVPVGVQPTLLTEFPTPDRESVVASVFPSFTGEVSRDRTIVLLLSRMVNEGQEAIVKTLGLLFIFGLAIIGLIVVFGLMIGRYLLRETGRRRLEDQRRSTARTLLVTSRALNSSLDLNVVLQGILGELGNILPHDSASIWLLNDEKDALTVVAGTGKAERAAVQNHVETPLRRLRGAREVVMTGKPVVINDINTDPRWKVTPESETRAWLGVPLRVREEAVGVLNIDSYQANRFMPDDIDLAEAFADQAGVAIQNARAHEVQIKAYETELETARAIQLSLLPHEEPPIPQIQIASRSIPAHQVSGDYYQYYILPDGKLGIAVGDVSGKGIPAALLMAVISTTLRDEILHNSAPAALLDELNTRLMDRMRLNNMNSALLLALFDPQTRHLELANGGMVQPYICNGAGWVSIPVGGYPLGAASKSSYKSKTVTLAPDSMVVIVSDGVVESQNLRREFFGFERLEALLAEVPPTMTADEVADLIVQAVRRHLEGQEPQDDITIVTMKSIELN
ncbi:MAG: SpoIIE family protein phosphatase [Chloroflexota bacterium]